MRIPPASSGACTPPPLQGGGLAPSRPPPPPARPLKPHETRGDGHRPASSISSRGREAGGGWGGRRDASAREPPLLPRPHQNGRRRRRRLRLLGRHHQHQQHHSSLARVFSRETAIRRWGGGTRRFTYDVRRGLSAEHAGSCSPSGAALLRRRKPLLSSETASGTNCIAAAGSDPGFHFADSWSASLDTLSKLLGEV